MFHIVELLPNNKKGTIENWEYDIVHGWQQNLNASFPPKIGFGGNLDLKETARAINDLLLSNDKKPILYEDIIQKFENLGYIMPDKLVQLRNILDEYNISTQPAFPLRPIVITEIVK